MIAFLAIINNNTFYSTHTHTCVYGHQTMALCTFMQNVNTLLIWITHLYWNDIFVLLKDLLVRSWHTYSSTGCLCPVRGTQRLSSNAAQIYPGCQGLWLNIQEGCFGTDTVKRRGLKLSDKILRCFCSVCQICSVREVTAQLEKSVFFACDHE